MTATCPSGHGSATDDYCDTCGAPITAPPGPAAADAVPSLECPHCGSAHEADELFCEVCGLDFATGRLPDAPPPPAPADTGAGAAAGGAAPAAWVVTVEADRAFFDTNQAETPSIQLLFPEGRTAVEVPLRGDEVLIGRRSDRAGHFPEIDLTGVADDPGVSRRHALLRRTAAGWELVDQGSTNGTRVGGAGEPVAAGQPVPLGDGARVHLGAWTCLTLRRTDTPAP